MNSRSVSGWTRVAAWTALVTALPITLQAHPGHPEVSSWISGAFHPLSGWDHALALLGAGLWGVQWGGRARWVFPAVFLGGMAAGVPLATRVGTLPGLESFVLASLLVLGLGLAFAVRASLPAAASLVGVFALAHGASHGLESGPGLPPMAYAAGFLMSSAVWLAIGAGLGLAARRLHEERWLRWAGAALAIGGLWGLAA
ncbi:MAG: HupE/UreJ family protein [Verrucomicrobia bacterium]|nr:HupE/UreJ family protein [Verrucomicrobiota bacterium]